MPHKLIGQTTFRLSSLVCVLLLTACGGGGGGTSGTGVSSQTPNNSSNVGSSSSGSSFRSMGGTGRATIAWNTNPTNIDGSCSAGAEAYRISVGLASQVYLVSETIPMSELSCSVVSSSACGAIERCTYTIEGLSQASWYIAAQTVDNYGYQSGYSNEAVASIN